MPGSGHENTTVSQPKLKKMARRRQLVQISNKLKKLYQLYVSLSGFVRYYSHPDFWVAVRTVNFLRMDTQVVL